jgi:hypothetical protein
MTTTETTRLADILAATFYALRQPGADMAALLGVFADALEEAGDARAEAARGRSGQGWGLTSEEITTWLLREFTRACNGRGTPGSRLRGSILDCRICGGLGWTWRNAP